MNKDKGYKLTICLLTLTIIIILGTIYILFNTGTISFHTKETNNTTISNTENNNNELLATGLFMYKYANQIENIFFTRDNKIIINYDYVATNFTDSFIEYAKNNTMCWPKKENNIYYLNDDCSTSTPMYEFKSIKIKEKTSNKVLYIITISDANNKNLEQEFEIVLENNIWKINKFIYNYTKVFF